MAEIPVRPSKMVEMPETAQERLIEFAEKQLNKMKTYCDLGNGTPGFYELNNALMNFNEMNCSLIGLDLLAKTEFQHAKNVYQEWYAEKYIEAREILNPSTLAKSKWASSTEIEYYIQTHWKDEYIKLRDEKDAAEMKVAFVRRLLDNLADYKFNVSTICKNSQVEAANLLGFRDPGDA